MINVLKASAGTGKTYRLSLEYVVNLLQGVDFEKIGVMTFTRKATGEIRQRILEHLAEIVENPVDSEVVDNLREIYPDLEINPAELRETYHAMLQNKAQIKVATIDSFINLIFNQAVAPYLNVYDYEIISNKENEEIIEAVFKRILDNDDYFQQMEKFLTANVKRDVDDYIDLLQEIIDNRWKFMLIESELPEERVAGDITAQFERCVEMLKKIAREKGNNFGRDYFRKDFSDYFDLSRQDVTDWLVNNYKLFINEHFWNGNKTRGKSVQDLKEAMAAEYEKFRSQLAAQIYNREMLPYQKQVIDFSQQVFQVYDRVKFKEKKFTHADISNYTYQCLHQPELNLLEGNQVSSYFFELLGTELETLLIDEFQDTSVLQWKILKPLINKANQLIAVGDEKQSIYSWRGGEKKLFANLEDILAGTSETLATSYRSERAVIEFVNRFFNEIQENWDYSSVDHLAEKNGGYVEVLVGGKQGSIRTDTKKFARRSETQQQQIKALNRQLTTNLAGKIATTIKEKIENYGEVGILARTNDDLKQIARELDERGVPYILESQDSLVEHQAVKPIYYLSGYLAFGDYFELIKFLRSEVVGVESSSLKDLINNRAQVEKYLKGETAALPNQDLAEILSFVQKLERLDFKSLPRFMIDKLGLVERYADNPNALKNIYRFFNLMKSYDQLIDFMTYLEENKTSNQLKQVGLDDVEAVKLLTIHKAKGLSFETEFFYWDISSGRGGNGEDNFEFYLDLDKQFEEVTDYLLTNSKYNKLLNYLEFDFYERKQQRKFMEEINNVYVAMTRAKRNLFLYVDVPKQFDGQEWETWEWNGKDYELYESAILRGTQADCLKDLTEKKSWGQLQESESEINFSEGELEGVGKYFVAGSTRRETSYQEEIGFTLSGENKRVTGLAIHYYLEQIKYNRAEERKLARDLVRAKYGNLLGPAKLKEVFARVENFLEQNSDYFSARWQVLTEHEIEVVGETYRIDRLMVDEEKRVIVIVDYKTGVSGEKDQLATYKSIIEPRLTVEYEVKTEFLYV